MCKICKHIKKKKKKKEGGQEGMMQCWIVGKTYWPKTDPFAPFQHSLENKNN